MPESDARATPDSPPTSIDGDTLLRVLAGGRDALIRNAEALNAINVFPVPDGDTGTNMSSTMRAALDDIQPGSASEVARAVVHAALMGAKGNSGVILSQIVSGLSAALSDRDDIDALTFAVALEHGRAGAYRVVSNPREGTILTAISAAADAASATASAGDLDATLAAAADAGLDAAARTPELLPVLREAGVVDAGAQGLAIMLAGMLAALRGDEAPAAATLGSIDSAWLAGRTRAHAHGDSEGFCTEFVIEGGPLDSGAVRDRLAPLGESLLVVGDATAVRVHMHTMTPDDAIAAAREFGAVSREKVDDMTAQADALATHAVEGTAIVAVVAGDGLAELFRSLGASAIVHGGQTMNPSAGDIRAAIEGTGAREAIVLPNNENIVLAAQQAIEGLATNARVVWSRSIPQGVAALVAMNPDASLDDNVTSMTEAIANVATGEITLAARATKLHGIEIAVGQPIALIDGDLALAADTVVEATVACIRRMLEGHDDPVITLYTGTDATTDDTQPIAAALGADPGVEIEIVDGGQPHYPYLIGVE